MILIDFESTILSSYNCINAVMGRGVHPVESYTCDGIMTGEVIHSYMT